MKWTLVLSTIFISFSALSFTSTFKGTVDISQNNPDFRYASSYKGKFGVTMTLSADSLHLVEAKASKAYWGDVDVHEDDSYWCTTYMSFSPITATYIVTDEAGQVIATDTKLDTPKASHSVKMVSESDECQVTIPAIVSMEMKGLYHDYLKVDLKNYPDRLLDLMSIVLWSKSALVNGVISDVEFADQQMQWFIYHKGDYRPGETVGSTVKMFKQ